MSGPLKKAATLLSSKRNRNVAYTVGGMAALLTGRKVAALSLFGKGLSGLEKEWRAKHPDFNGDMSERWEESISFYEETHTEPTNRTLHKVGIPMILGGATGLLLFRPFRPLWLGAATSFTVGWALNIVGHAKYEKNAPAFADDPLSLIAGLVWDLKQGGKSRAEEAMDRAAKAVHDVDSVVLSDDDAKISTISPQVNVGGETAIA